LSDRRPLRHVFFITIRMIAIARSKANRNPSVETPKSM